MSANRHHSYSRSTGGVNRTHTSYSSERSATASSMSDATNSDLTSASSNDNANQPRAPIQQSSGVVRRHGTRNFNATANNDTKPPSDSSNQRPRRGFTNTYENRNSFPRRNSTASTQPTENKPPKSSNLPNISYPMVTKLLDKTPDLALADMLQPHFQLKRFLNDKRMQTHYDWIVTMTKLLEKITKCEGSRERIGMILASLPETTYLEGVYDEVRKPDPITDQLRYEFIQSFLKVTEAVLSMIPHSAGDLTKIIERIELQFTKTKNESPEHEETKALLAEIVEHANEIESRKRENQRPRNTTDSAHTTISTTTVTRRETRPPPDDYRQLPIVPNVTEILSERKTYLRENIVDGVYADPEQYLDIHFRLLREDFVGPLRDGIDQYLSGKEGKNFNVRVYENVRSLGPRLNPRSGIVYDLLLDAKMASRFSWANSRRLIYGNLLVLTFDRFQSCAFVTVEDRSRIEKDFVISVKTLEKSNNQQELSVDLDDIDFSYSLTMIETTTYFEAYRPVLNALQMIPTDHTFPLSEFLLKLTNDALPPNYITTATTYDFTPLLVSPKSSVKADVLIHELVPARVGRGRGPIRPITEKEFRITYKEANQVKWKYKAVPLLDQDQWPTSDELHLNPKQREALILALTNKVALIQGPPGTGKTFLGVRITEMLLHNRSVWCPQHEQSTPILMICHTNHALDQFLELTVKRLDISDGIIRVGNRCQNPAIQRFSLLNARRSVRDNRLIPSSIYHQKHTIFDRKTEAEEALKIHEHKIEQSRNNILTLTALMDYDVLEQRHHAALLAPFNGEYDQVSEDLMYLMEVENSMSKVEIKDEEKPKETTEEEEKIENAEEGKTEEKEKNEEEEEEERRRNELEMEEEYFTQSGAQRPQTTTTVEGLMDVQITTKADPDDPDQTGWTTVQKKPYDRRRIIQYILHYSTTLTDQTISQVPTDVWSLPTDQRYDLYRYWLLKYQQKLHYSVRDARHEYNRAIAALAEYHQEEDYYILKDSVIVAMTTTCAAKYHTVLEKLQSKIVIVEEAAAIFEAHIITALSTRCEHLILIGDHVQLRPNPSVYRLATKYHIDVSLFERFVKNNFPNIRLNIQHRMRPEIAALMKHFYDDLEDHQSVKTERAPVPGVENNVFFINHNHLETTVADGSSKRNDFEARYVIALAQYLVKQGYRADQITILVMYLGQRQYIARSTKNIKLLQGLRIMVTDNYQGEENDIIILSLVRNNPEKKIGFLSIHNRICVALSRARCGFFLIGNLNLLAEVEDKWKQIGKTLYDAQAVGKGLGLSCRQHSRDKFHADSPESFAQRPEGGCNKPCDARLKCGHQCQLMCHNYDFEHKEVICHKVCNETLPCGHQCTKRCHVTNPTQHNACRVPVDKTITPCGHKIRFQCSQTPTTHDCTQPILKRLPCDHAVNVPCGIASSPADFRRFACPTLCNTMLECKHKCPGTCGTCRTGQLHVPCGEKCGRELICSHVCKAPCAANCPPCLAVCETRCVHSKCTKKCGELCIPCKEPCAYKCKHLQCTRLCSEPCDRGPCNEPCDKKLKCGHDCIGICGEPCPRQCRICNKLIVQEIFFGTEDQPDARFVFLPDCNHIVEVTSLDHYVENFLRNTPDNTSICFPECPRCKRKMRRCTRYMAIINQVNQLIAQVKKKILGNQTDQEMRQRRKDLIKEYEKLNGKIQEIHLPKLQAFFNELYNDENIFSHDIFILMENMLFFINEIDKLLIKGRQKLSPNIFESLVSPPLRHIADYLLKHQKYRNFATQQVQDIEWELKRLERLIYVEALIASLDKPLKPSEKDDIDFMQQSTKKPGRFNDEDQQRFDSLAKKLQHLNHLPGLGITESERKAIVSALNMAKGHWYVCPKGHPYVITECGGANQESTCPECGAKIGGQNHQLVPTNRHFGLMDGSQHAAWSNEANLDMAQPLM